MWTELPLIMLHRFVLVQLFAIVSLWAALSVHTDRTDSSEAASSEWVAVNYLTGALCFSSRACRVPLSGRCEVASSAAERNAGMALRPEMADVSLAFR